MTGHEGGRGGGVRIRVAKCHGYGGYIRVKNLDDWGKKSVRTHNFAKSSIVLGKFEQLISNSVFKPGLYDRMFSFCSPEKAFMLILFLQLLNLLRFTHFSWG